MKLSSRWITSVGAETRGKAGRASINVAARMTALAMPGLAQILSALAIACQKPGPPSRLGDHSANNFPCPHSRGELELPDAVELCARFGKMAVVRDELRACLNED